MTTAVESLRADIVQTSHALHANGWVANHDGNLSARLEDDHLLCTPTAVSKGDVQPEWLIVVDAENQVIEGTRRAFSELQLHRAAYAARPDISVVIHAHPPTATGFAVAGVELDHPFMAEPVVSLGPNIPTVPYHRPGSEGLTQAVKVALRGADVVLLERHGVLAVGGGFEQAFLRMELVEHLAKIALAARQLGGVRPLPAEDVAALAQRGRPPSQPAREGAASGTGEKPGRPNVTSLVGDALKRFGS